MLVRASYIVGENIGVVSVSLAFTIRVPTNIGGRADNIGRLLMCTRWAVQSSSVVSRAVSGFSSRLVIFIVEVLKVSFSRPVIR